MDQRECKRMTVMMDPRKGDTLSATAYSQDKRRGERHQSTTGETRGARLSVMYLYCFSSYTSPFIYLICLPPNLVPFSPVCASLYLRVSILFQLERSTNSVHAVSSKAGILEYKLSWRPRLLEETAQGHILGQIRAGRRRKGNTHTLQEKQDEDVHEDVCAFNAGLSLHNEQQSPRYTQPMSVQKSPGYTAPG